MIRERILACQDMDAVKIVLRDIRSSFGGDVVIDGSDVRDVRLLAVISSDNPEKLCPGCRTPADLVDKLLSDEAVAKAMDGFLKVVALSASTDIGTHIPKAPDPTVGTDAFFEAAPGRPGAVPFLTGDFVEAVRRVGGSGGDAKRAKATRLLRARVRYGNHAASLGEVVAESRKFRELLVEAGWPSDIVEQVRSGIERKASGPSHIQSVDPSTKVILFPLPDGGYRQVSPVTSVALWNVLRTRIASDRRKEGAERRTYAMRRRSVGGTKAQNVAVEASDSGGRMEVLVSMPPSFRPILPIDRVMFRLKASGTSFTGRIPSDDVVAAVRRLSYGDYVNVDVRGGLRIALSGIAAAWLEGPMSLGRAVDAGMQIDPDLFRDGVERALVLEGFEALDRTSRIVLAQRLGAYIADIDDSSGKLVRFRGDDALDALDRAIEDALSPASDDEAPGPEAEEEPKAVDEEDGEPDAAALRQESPKASLGKKPAGPAKASTKGRRK